MIRPVMAIETVLPERCIALRSVRDAQDDSQRVDFLSCAFLPSSLLPYTFDGQPEPFHGIQKLKCL